MFSGGCCSKAAYAKLRLGTCPTAGRKFTNRHCSKPPIHRSRSISHYKAHEITEMTSVLQNCPISGVHVVPHVRAEAGMRLVEWHAKPKGMPGWRTPFTTDLRIVGRSDAGKGLSDATRGSLAGLSSSTSAAISSTLGKESACSALSGMLRGSVSSIMGYHDICR